MLEAARFDEEKSYMRQGKRDIFLKEISLNIATAKWQEHFNIDFKTIFYHIELSQYYSLKDELAKIEEIRKAEEAKLEQQKRQNERDVHGRQQDPVFRRG